MNVTGSYREHPAGWHRVGEPAPDEILGVTVVLRRRESALGADLVERCLSREAVCDLDQLGSSGKRVDTSTAECYGRDAEIAFRST